MKPILILAAALALFGVLCTCESAKAGPAEDYAAKRWAEGVTDAHQVRHELLQPVPVYTTGTVVRVTRQDENRLKALVVPDLLTAAEWVNVEKRDERIDNALDSKMGAAGITDAQFIAIAKIEARVRVLRRKIERAGGDAVGPQAGASTAQVVKREPDGPPLWQAKGATEPPTIEAVAGAMK